jgi:hypothetical protein
MADPLLNTQRQRGKVGSTRSAKLSVPEQRFYSAAPRFEDIVKRACSRSVIMLRADVAEGMVRGLVDLEVDYESARTDSMAQNRSVSELEARYGAAIVLVHLQLLSKVAELDELAGAGTPIADVTRLAHNLVGICSKLADIEARASIATTGDLNEEERQRIKLFTAERSIRVAEAVQLRREATAANRRLLDGQRDGDDALVARAKERMADIRSVATTLKKTADLSREVELDQVLKQIEQLVKEER